MYLAHGYAYGPHTVRSRVASKLCDWCIVRAPFPAMSLSKNATASSKCASVSTTKGYEPQSKHRKKKLAEAKLIEQYLGAKQPERVPLHNIGWHQRNRGGLYDVAYQDYEVQVNDIDSFRKTWLARYGMMPGYTVISGNHFVAAQQLIKEKGSNFSDQPERCGEIAKERLRLRFQVCWENLSRRCWMLYFDEVIAMRWVFSDQNTTIGYEPQAQINNLQTKGNQWSKVLLLMETYTQELLSEATGLHKPFKPRTGHVGSYRASDEAPCRQRFTLCTTCESGPTGDRGEWRPPLEIIFKPLTGQSDMMEFLEHFIKPAGEDYESQVICMDSHASHMDASSSEFIESRGHVVLLHGGGLTEYEQPNDTDMHQSLRKEYERL